MKRHAYSPLLIVVSLLAAFAVSAFAAAVGDPPRPAAPATPPQPGGISPGPAHAAPTANLQAVLNALKFRYKGLTTLATIPPGLSLTQPVEISIAYFSTTGSTNRITQTYNAQTGNRFLYHDPEADGNPRGIRVDLWLSEPNPGGGLYTYSDRLLEGSLFPIYNVTISPLSFKLGSDCDRFGDVNEVRFYWFPPDAKDGNDYKSFSFHARKGQVVSINRFVWGRADLTRSLRLKMPVMMFDDIDPTVQIWPPLAVDYHDYAARLREHFRSGPDLLPGKTRLFRFGLFSGQFNTDPTQIRGNTCIATIEYTITYLLRTYTEPEL